jgi:peptidoglycan hydrolase-like protein with peptidoglycan-binding domain
MGVPVHQAIEAVGGPEKMDGGNDVPPCTYNGMGRATLTLLWEVIAMKRFVVMLGISLLIASGLLPLQAEARGATSRRVEVRDQDLVRDVQRQLKAQGFYPGAVDGNVGSQTTTALRAYQRSYRLPETGRLDEATLRSLLPERSEVSRAPETSRVPVDLSNREVRRDAQRQLKALGFDPGSTDGTFGPQTEAALRAYQHSYRLPETGRLDDVTLRSLLPERRQGALR